MDMLGEQALVPGGDQPNADADYNNLNAPEEEAMEEAEEEPEEEAAEEEFDLEADSDISCEPKAFGSTS